MKRKYRFISCGVLVAMATFICLYVEYYNYRAGGMLPNHDGVKLRYGVEKFIEPHWRRSHGYDDPSLLQGRELTAQEQAILAEETIKTRHSNRVVACTRSWGLLQYLLAPAALLWSVILLLTTKGLYPRIMALLMSSVSLACLYLLFYRGYFND